MLTVLIPYYPQAVYQSPVEFQGTGDARWGARRNSRRLSYRAPTIEAQVRAQAQAAQAKPSQPAGFAGGALAGLKAGGVTGCFSAAAVTLAHYFSPGFRRALGTSGRTSLVITPAFAAFLLASQFHYIRANPNSAAANTGEPKKKD